MKKKSSALILIVYRISTLINKYIWFQTGRMDTIVVTSRFDVAVTRNACRGLGSVKAQGFVYVVNMPTPAVLHVEFHRN